MGRHIAKIVAMSLLAVACLADVAQAAPPAIVSTTVSAATTTSVVLEARINPNEKATKYHFEYGPQDCSSNPCTSTPDEQIKSGNEAVTVSTEVKNLAPGTTYHLRVVAKHSNEAGGEVAGADRTFMTYLLPPQFGGCPNEALRTENPAAARVERQSSALPDCRAYEQATPVGKNGGDVTGYPSYERAAADGNGIIYLSASGVPGGAGSQEVPAYLASRGASGWSSHGMLPPANTGQFAELLGWTPNLADIYSAAGFLSEPDTFTLLRSGAGAPPSTIADYAPEASYFFAGAVEDGSVVLYETGAGVEGNTVAGISKVYAWDRATDTLHQVDVFNDATSPSRGAFAGSYDWVHGANVEGLESGGAFSGYYTQDEHAMAADGSAAYFTEAGSGQLYVRLNPTEPQSPTITNGSGEEVCTNLAEACTLHVSASQKHNGKGEGGGDPAGTRPAAFMAASADGRRAFFTSSQMLTDHANTGPEKEPAAVVRSDKEGENVQNCAFTHAQDVAVDAEHIYWINLESGAIGREKIDCTDPEEEFIPAAQLEVEPGVSVAANPRGLAVKDGFLYWANAAREDEGTIGKAKLNGDGPATEINQEFVKGARNPQAVAVDSVFVY